MNDSTTNGYATLATSYANMVSNKVLSSLIIGYRPLQLAIANYFPSYEKDVDNILDNYLSSATNITEDKKALKNNIQQWKLQTKTYFKLLKAMVQNQEPLDFSIGGVFDTAFTTIISNLRFLGLKEINGKFYPNDENICLSITDVYNAENKDYDSETLKLNRISNCVVRAIRYGDFSERCLLADILRRELSHKMTDGIQPNSCIFSQALLNLLREGKESTIEKITFLGPKSSSKEGFSNITGYVPHRNEAHYRVPHHLRLFEPYRSVLYKILNLASPDPKRFSSPEATMFPIY